MQKHDGITVAGNVINHLSKRRLGDARREDRRRNVIGYSLSRRTAKSVAGSQSHRTDHTHANPDSENRLSFPKIQHASFIP